MNFGRINDPSIDKLLDEGRSEPDPAKRKKIYEDLNREFAKQVWNVWLSYTPWAVAESRERPRHPRPRPARRLKPSAGLATGHPLLGLWIDRTER